MTRPYESLFPQCNRSTFSRNRSSFFFLSFIFFFLPLSFVFLFDPSPATIRCCCCSIGVSVFVLRWSWCCLRPVWFCFFYLVLHLVVRGCFIFLFVGFSSSSCTRVLLRGKSFVEFFNLMCCCLNDGFWKCMLLLLVVVRDCIFVLLHCVFRSSGCRCSLWKWLIQIVNPYDPHELAIRMLCFFKKQ